MNYLTIQQQLEETEDEIVRACAKYNKSVKGYNAAIRYFPSNVIAAAFYFQPKEYFESMDKYETIFKKWEGYNERSVAFILSQKVDQLSGARSIHY